MASCKGIHCPGCGDDGVGIGTVILLILFGLIIAARHTIAHDATDVLHAILIAIAIVAITAVTIVSGIVTYRVTKAVRYQKAIQRMQAPSINESDILEVEPRRVIHETVISCEVLSRKG